MENETVLKKYEDGTVLMYKCNKKSIDYFFNEEFKNTLVFEDISKEKFIASDEYYEKAQGIKCKTKVLSVNVLQQPKVKLSKEWQEILGIKEEED